MRILEHRIFLSLLAGKFSAFEQMLLTEPIFLKKAHAYCEHRIFFLFFGGKIQNFKTALDLNFFYSPTPKRINCQQFW